jgi:starvation-inducible outer membrane lipoprotein
MALRILALCALFLAGCATPGAPITPERQAAIDKANEQPSPYYYGGP